MRDTPRELIWTVGMPFMVIVLLYFLPTPQGHSTDAILIWCFAILCAVTRWFLPVYWFNNVAFADATYFIIAVGGIIFTAEAVLNYFFGLSILKLVP